MDETQGSCWKVKHLVIWTQTFNMTTPCQVKRKWKLVIVAEIVQDSSTRTWNRRGEKIGSEESSIRTWNRREKFTGSEESSRKVYRVRGFVDQEWKSSRKIYRVRGIVDQDEESSTGSEDLSTRGWNRRPGPRLHRPGPRIRRPGPRLHRPGPSIWFFFGTGVSSDISMYVGAKREKGYKAI